MREKLVEAARDLRYLLDRGYRRERVLDIIVERYMLNSKERSALYRCIHSASEALEVVRKLVLTCKRLAVDLFNCLITAIAIVKGEEVYVCDDCLVRDVRGSKIRRSDEPYLPIAMELVAKAIHLASPLSVAIVAERQVSNSAVYAHTLAKSLGLHSLIAIVDRVDTYLTGLCRDGYAVATTDIVVVRECDSVYPLTSIVLALAKRVPTIDFSMALRSPCPVPTLTHRGNELV